MSNVEPRPERTPTPTADDRKLSLRRAAEKLAEQLDLRRSSGRLDTIAAQSLIERRLDPGEPLTDDAVSALADELEEEQQRSGYLSRADAIARLAEQAGLHNTTAAGELNRQFGFELSYNEVRVERLIDRVRKAGPAAGIPRLAAAEAIQAETGMTEADAHRALDARGVSSTVDPDDVKDIISDRVGDESDDEDPDDGGPTTTDGQTPENDPFGDLDLTGGDDLPNAYGEPDSTSLSRILRPQLFDNPASGQAAIDFQEHIDAFTVPAPTGITPGLAPPDADLRVGMFSALTPTGPNREMAEQPITLDTLWRMVMGLEDAELLTLQFALFEGGYFEGITPDGRPTWGFNDEATLEAFKLLMRDVIPSGQRIEKVLGKKQAEWAAERALRVNEERETRRREIESRSFTTTHPASVNAMIDFLAEENLGGLDRLTPGQRSQLVDRFNQRERHNALARIDAELGPDPMLSEGSEVDRFMAAIMGQESDGDPTVVSPDGARGLFQFMPSTWQTQARIAGVDPSDFSVENQKIVARSYMLQLFRQFNGSWADVAAAWYAGGDWKNAVAQGRLSLTAKQRSGGITFPSVNEYVAEVMARFNSGSGTTLGGQPTERSVLNPEDELQLALKAMNPQAWLGNEWADRAMEFMGMLAGAAR